MPLESRTADILMEDPWVIVLSYRCFICGSAVAADFSRMQYLKGSISNNRNHVNKNLGAHHGVIGVYPYRV